MAFLRQAEGGGFPTHHVPRARRPCSWGLAVMFSHDQFEGMVLVGLPWNEHIETEYGPEPPYSVSRL